MSANAHPPSRYSLEEQSSASQAYFKNATPDPHKAPLRDTDRDQPWAGTFLDEDGHSRRSPKESKSGHKPRSSSQKLSNELHFRSHVTRDSMVVNLLSSFNQIPDGQGPLPDENFKSSFETSDLAPEPPAPVTSEPLHFRDFSSSAVASTNRAPDQDYDPYQNRTTPIKGASFSPKMPKSVDRTGDPLQDSPNKTRSSAGSRPGTAKSSKSDKKKQKSRGSNKSVDQGDSRTAKSSQAEEQTPGRSSSSFDLNPKDKSRRRSRTNPGSASILNRARPVPVEYHDFESSRFTNSNQHVSLPRHSTRPAISERESSARALQDSAKPQSSGRNKAADLTGSDMILDNRANPSTAQDSSRQPSMQTLNATASGWATPTSSGTTKQNTPSDSTKGKQSFFRRVFGTSTKANTPTKPEELPYLLPPIPTVQTLESKRSRSALSNDYEPLDRPALQDRTNSSSRAPPPVPPEAPAEQPHVIQKKTSFFRRRKRTASITNDSVDIVADAQADESSAKRPSVSSLQQVMKPFLGDTPTVAAPLVVSPVETTYYDSKEQQSVDLGYPNTSRSGSRTSKVLADGAEGSTLNSKPPIHKEGESPVAQAHKSFLYDSSAAVTPTEKRSVPRFENFQHAETNQGIVTTAQRDTLVSPKQRNASSRSPATESPGVSTERIQSGTIPSTVRLIPSDDADEAQVVRIRQRSPAADDSPRRRRIWLHPEGEPSISAPSTSASASRITSVSSVPSQEFQTSGSPRMTPVDAASRSTSITAESVVDATTPTQEDVARAKQLFDGHGDVLTQQKAAALLGQFGIASDRLREAYMAMFDFSGLNILLALRDLCGRLALKGETQQVDRILTAFSQRWVDCNPDNGFKNQDVVHTMCYSLLLLNTDLHIADLDQKMTRSQFVRNTLETIRQAANEEPFQQNSMLRADHANKRGSIPWRDTRSPSPASVRRPSADIRTPDHRLSVKPPGRPVSEVPSVSSPGPYDARVTDTSDLLVNVPFDGTARGWEAQIEIVLKEHYLSIRQLKLPLYGASEVHLQDQPSSTSLGVGNGVIRRPSVLSKAPADGARRGSDFHSWNIRNRSKQRMYQNSTHGSSRTSFDDGSVFSPNASSTWSRSFSKAPTSMSSDSIASRFTNADYGFQQSIGFANALSHAIIREEDGAAANAEEENGTTNLLDDETLELEGAPWAKEGMVQHKHHMETAERKAKDRNWSQCFAVVEKGCIRLFSFNSKASIRSQKNRSLKGGGVVGGGNWMDSAEALGTFTLRQTLANTLPSPGYSKSRPHVFALVFPTGAVHLFHVGTPEIAKEFVSTANYWSARLSKEPLVGGVSNVEYGWSDNVINTALLSNPESSRPESSHPPSASSAARRLHSPTPSTSNISARPSLQGSLRGGSIDLPSRARLPGDRVALSEWVPPQQSMSRSDLKEKEQLEGLKRYVKDVEDELRQHNELRAVLLLTFSPRHPNASKAMSNWERKSSYLLREIVKFRTYIDTLIAAQAEREKVYKERAERLVPVADTETENIAA